MKVTIIANPISGGGLGQIKAARLRTALEAAGANCQLCITTKAGHAIDYARQVDADCIAIIGGDGTLNEVLNGLEDFQGFLAPLPMGTANVVARQLALPKVPEELAPLILARRYTEMDVGRHGDRRFLLGAGAGLDAAVTEITQAGRGKKSSLWMWVLPAARVLFSRPYPTLRVYADGELLAEASPYTVVGICRNSAGIFPATPDAVIDDGLLDVCTFTRLALWQTAITLCTVFTPLFRHLPWVTHAQATTIELIPNDGQRVPLQIDGDPAGELPGIFTIERRAIRIVTPRAAARDAT